MPHQHSEHVAAEGSDRPVRCAILTISDTRTPDTDHSGDRIRDIITEFGHSVVQRMIVPDDPENIRTSLESWIVDHEVEAILATGGTGVSRRDNTIEVVREMLDAELDGFGELFRMLSWQEVRSAAMLSRAIGGVVIRGADRGGDTLVFAMPGSVNACEIATRKLIAPELGHLRWERRR